MSTKPAVGLAASLLGLGLVVAAFLLGRAAPPLLPWLDGVIALQLVGGLGTAWLGTRDASPLARRSWSLVVIVAVAARLLIAGSPHVLSDDAFRYVWDGKVSRAGVNPYLHAPDDPEVAHLREPRDERINHPDVVTVYPPLAQAAFVAAHALAPERPMTGLHGLFLGCELITWILVGVALARARLPWTRLLLLAWFPLVWVHGYTPGHTDILGLPFLVVFGLAALGHRTVPAGVALGLAVLVKPFALAFVPGAARAMGIRRTFGMGLIAFVVVALGYVSVFSAGTNLWSSTALMARSWSFNGSLAALVDLFASGTSTRLFLGATSVLLVSAVVLARRSATRTALLTFTAIVVCTTTLYPWYLTWMFPLLVWVPDPALLTLASTVAFADLVVGPYQSRGLWDPSPAHAVAVYAPFYAMLIVAVLKRWGMFAASSRRDVSGRGGAARSGR